MNRDSRATAAILALAAVGKIGPVKIKALLTGAEHPADILGWSVDRLCTVPGIERQLANHIKQKGDVDYGLRLIEWADKNRFSVITLCDPDYPPSLRELYDAPPFLFVAGHLTDDDIRAIAIVGSRTASDYGKMTASELAGQLSRHGVTIVSGMAVGVDSASHRGALEAGGRTIAVMGSGIDIIYPTESRKLYRQIIDNGAVISEFFPGTKPSPGHFPRRNRIIAGLSQGVVVVEAGNRSGALLTADLALAQQKKLFAVPGNLSSRLSAGTNALIKSGAYLLTSYEDIFSVLPELKKGYIVTQERVASNLTEGENLVLKYISASPIQLDTLVRACGVSVSDAASYLLSLELRGLVKQLSGKRFITI